MPKHCCMRVAIHGKIFQKEVRKHIQDLFVWLAKNEVDTCLSNSFFRILKKAAIKDLPTNIYTIGEDLRGYDFFLSLGGDGTL
ncbi:MAG: NAD(+) kinase, partial [Raineya sp.]